MAAFAAALCLAPAAALACSVDDDYRVPTNLELAGQADTVLLAKVVGAHPPPKGRPFMGSVTIHPLAALKGELPKGDIDLPGMMPPPKPAFLILSDPYDFVRAHPLTYLGSCIRTIFPVGTTALFFLQRRDGRWASAGGPFSRWAEDVPGADAPWVRLADLYVRAAALPEAERKALLIHERDGWRAQTTDPVAQLQAADIDRQLAGPNPPWNALMDRQAAQASADGETGTGDGAQAPQVNSVDASLNAMRVDPNAK